MGIKNLLILFVFLLFSCAATVSPRYTTLKTTTMEQKNNNSKNVKKHSKVNNNEVLKKQWELYYIVKNLLFKPYVWGGADPNKGFDCSGLVYYAYKKKLNFDIPRTSKELFKVGERIRKNQLKFGDLVFFKKTPYSKTINHVGIYVNNNKFLHASSSKGVTISSLTKKYWKSRFAGARRVLIN